MSEHCGLDARYEARAKYSFVFPVGPGALEGLGGESRGFASLLVKIVRDSRLAVRAGASC